jgi:hypothetical protein
VDVPKVTTGQAHGTSGWLFGEPYESSHTSTSWHKEAVLDAQTFRTLLQYQAVALLSINGHAWDDVLNMLAVYV